MREHVLLVHFSLERAAARTPDAIALVTEERRLTFAQLDREASTLAHGLREVGVRRGDRVAIYLDNRAEAVVALLAALKAGAAFMMVHPGTKDQKLAYLLEDSEARAMVMPSDRVAPLEHVLATAPALDTIVSTEASDAFFPGKQVIDLRTVLAEAPRSAPDPGTIDQDLAGLLYTSGTTGRSKGVMLTHVNIRSAVESIVSYLRLTDRDVLMDVLPLSFSYGLSQLFTALCAGARFVVEKNMTFPHLTLTRMAQEHVTGFSVVPTAAAVLVGMDLGRYDLSSLRYITNAGASLPPAHLKRLHEALPHVDVIPMYGQTECMRISYLEPSEVDRRPSSVGRGMPNQELRLVDQTGHPVAPGDTGELVVRGSHVMRGYWKQPSQTAMALRPGWVPGEYVLHTGDLFRQDDEGYLYYVGRRDDIFKCRGEKVSPREVEDVLHRLPAVAEAVVLGEPDATAGHVVKAVLVLHPGMRLTVRDVRRHCAACLEDFMIPAIVEFRESLPKTAAGKISRALLNCQHPEIAP